MRAKLLDSSVLIPLASNRHVFHDAARRWFVTRDAPFATCTITQGAHLRSLIRAGHSSDTAAESLTSITAHRHHEFWSADDPFTRQMLKGIVGHRQVTDAYLAQHARRRNSKIATFDEGMAALHPDVAELIPT